MIRQEREAMERRRQQERQEDDMEHELMTSQHAVTSHSPHTPAAHKYVSYGISEINMVW